MKYIIVDVKEPLDNRVVYKNAWWACIDGDPKKALFYNTSPQCNKQKSIIDWSIKQGQYINYNVIPVFIETAFVLNRN